MASADLQRAKIAATHEMALAMVQDLDHMRDLLSDPEPNARAIRSLSNELRRLLIDEGGDLPKIAGPRIGRFQLSIPDILPLEKAGRKQPWTFLSAGVADILGLSIDAWSVNTGSVARPMPNYDPERTVQVKMSGFLSQKVICFQGKWVSRSDVIQFVAKVGFGVHSDRPKSSAHELLRAIRHIAYIKIENGTPSLVFAPNNIRPDEKPISVDRHAIDFVLLQLISCARYLTMSPDLIHLEEIIKVESPF